jgi:hypothetical protein
MELTSEHFTLWTDAPAERARRIVQKMERLRRIVLGTAFENAADQPGRSMVIALRDRDEFHAFAPREAGAWTAPPGHNPLRQPLIVVAADAEGHDSAVFTHELTHVISYNVIREQPRWFAEGMAGYFETIRLDEEHGKVELGRPLDQLEARLQRYGLTPPELLFTCESSSCTDLSFYTTAFVLFSYLVNERRDDLATYERVLKQLPHGDGGEVFARIFPDLSPTELRGTLQHWLTEGKMVLNSFAVQAEEWPITERMLGDGDVYATRALLRVLNDQDPQLTRADVAAALAADPTEVIAQVVGVILRGGSIDGDTARAVAAAHPNDWRAQMLVAFALGNGPEADAARARACALGAENPAILLPDGLCPAEPR